MIGKCRAAAQTSPVVGFAFLLLLLGTLLASCGGGGATATTAISSTTSAQSSASTDSTISDSEAQGIQARLDAYGADIGTLGQKMMSAENAVAGLISAKNLAATSENIATASSAADTAAASWAEWKDRKAPIPQLDQAHGQLLVYLENMSSALAHFEQGIRTQSATEFTTFDQLVKVAYAAKKAAWNTLLNAGTLEPQ